MNLEVKFDCNQGAIRAVRFNKDGNYCITCGADKNVKLWNPYKQLRLQTYSGHSQGNFYHLFSYRITSEIILPTPVKNKKIKNSFLYLKIKFFALFSNNFFKIFV